MIFSELETVTLNNLYPDPDSWWEYLYLLSDRVQEDEGEVVAEGVRFLCEIRQRPYMGKREVWYGVCWWCASEKEDYQRLRQDSYRNYLPAELRLSVAHDFDTPTAALEAYLTNWTTLAPEVRAELWSTWVGEVCNDRN